jgi:hypothetical protein
MDMKLGTQTVSLVNHLMARGTIGQPEPVVGMGVTLLMWSDRNAGTIQAVSKDNKGRVILEITQDDSKVIAGSAHDGSAEYEYTERPDGYRYIFQQQDNGAWQEMTHKVKDYAENGDAILSKRLSKVSGGGKGLRIGERESYRDPSF